MFFISSCSCLYPIHWSQVLSREWRCSWSSADRRGYNYISERSIILLPTAVCLILEVWWYVFIVLVYGTSTLNSLSPSHAVVYWFRGPIHEWFFHLNSNQIENKFCPHPRFGEVIAMKVCTWHGSCAVMPCAKFFNDMVPYNRVTLKPIFYRI